MGETLKLLVIGAHPDDCDIKAGGLAAGYAERGHEVEFVSLTNGAAGHHEIGGVELARRRRSEASAAAAVTGIEYDVLDNPDGSLQVSLANREQIIRLVRRRDPDLLLTHRPNDYHPDHRNAAQLVQDAAYMVTVPNICTDVPALREDPVIAYLHDDFRKPAPFEPDVVVDIDDHVGTKLDMLDCHESQVYEWLPYNAGDGDGDAPTAGDGDPVPEEGRREWLAERWGPRFEAVADRFRDRLRERYGDHGAEIEYAEAFEACEYGAPLTEPAADRLFPF